MQRSEIIKDWTIKVDAPKLGLGVLAFIGITSSKSCLMLLDQLESIPCIEECHSVAGELCIFLKVRVTDTGALLTLIDRLRQIDGIEATETTIVLQTQFERPVSLRSLAASKKDV